MEGYFAVISSADYFPSGRRAIVVGGAVDSVDIVEDQTMAGYLDHLYSAFKIPVHALDSGMGK